MPDAPRFVRRILKAKLENRLGWIRLRVAQQRDGGGVPRVEREVEGILSFHPLDTHRPGSPGWNRSWQGRRIALKRWSFGSLAGRLAPGADL
jgi:hypothetical protein